MIVQRMVGRVPRSLWVSRVFVEVDQHEDSRDLAWLSADFLGLRPNQNEKVHHFVLIYVLAGSNSLPAISDPPFEKIFVADLDKRAGRGRI